MKNFINERVDRYSNLLWTLSLSTLIVGTFVLGAGATKISAQADRKSDQSHDAPQLSWRSGCSNASLRGNYAVISSGFAAPPPQTPLPFGSISLLSMDGDGSLTNKVTRSNNGFISRGVDGGIYSINPDCTGTMTISTPAPPFQLTFDLVIADHVWFGSASEFYFIATTPGGVVTASAKKTR